MTLFISPYVLLSGTSYETIYTYSGANEVLVKTIQCTNITSGSGIISVKWIDNNGVGIGTSQHNLTLATPVPPFGNSVLFSNGFIVLNSGDYFQASGNISGGIYVLISAVEQSPSTAF